MRAAARTSRDIDPMPVSLCRCWKSGAVSFSDLSSSSSSSRPPLSLCRASSLQLSSCSSLFLVRLVGLHRPCFVMVVVLGLANRPAGSGVHLPSVSYSL